MGCNTSKESAPAESEKNEKQDVTVEEKTKITLSDDNSESADNHVDEFKNSKPASAKTITLHSNDLADRREEQSTEEKPPSNKEVREEEQEEEDRAATKIQAAFRGHKTRQSMKQPTNSNTDEPTREELEAEFRLDDLELCNAATKIQASFRGHMTRKNKDEQKKDESSSSQAKQQDPEEELDIDLSDPELNKAAVKIQASFRGHMTRKDNDKEPAN